MPIQPTGTGGGRVSRPPWIKEETAPAASNKPAWARRNEPAAKPANGAAPTPAPKTDVSAKLQSREIKVPVMTEKAKLAPAPLQKPEPKVTKATPAQPEVKPKFLPAQKSLTKQPQVVEDSEEEEEVEEEEEEYSSGSYEEVGHRAMKSEDD
jgi:hypothetical protein